MYTYTIITQACVFNENPSHTKRYQYQALCSFIAKLTQKKTFICMWRWDIDVLGKVVFFLVF